MKQFFDSKITGYVDNNDNNNDADFQRLTALLCSAKEVENL